MVRQSAAPDAPVDAPVGDPVAERVHTQLAPIAPRERILVLDVLRGFALCGVLIGNLFWLYSGRGWNHPPDDGPLDPAARWFVELVVQSKAQTLLCFLFGFGFAAQLVRAERGGDRISSGLPPSIASRSARLYGIARFARWEPVTGVYIRRLVALLVIGALHVTLIWWGDVTWTYAVAGFGLLLFRRASNRARIIWAVVLTFVPYLVATQPPVALAAIRLFLDPERGRHFHEMFATGMREASYVSMMSIHVQFALVFELPIYLWYYPWLLGRFLLGYVAGTQRWFDNDGADHLPLFRKMLVGGSIITVASAAMSIAELADAFEGYELFTITRLAIRTLHQLGFLGQTAAYVAIIVLLIQRPAWRRVLGIIAPAGRMPLTTYVSQSVICTSLFYGWGLGWGGHTGAAACVGLSIAIFVVEVAVCHLWLRRFRFGPLEWLWRTLVYLRPQPMR